MSAIVNKLMDHVDLVGGVALKKREKEALVEADNIPGKQTQPKRAAEDQPIADRL